MAIGTGSKTSVAYVEESVYGTTPATPAFQYICNTGCTIKTTKDLLEAGCLNATRQISDVRSGNRQVAGDLNAELEYASYDDLIEAVLQGTWTADVLKAGVDQRSFTFERYFDLDTDEYHRYTGCVINTMSLSVQPNAMVETTFGVIGSDIDDANLTSQVAGATYSPETGNSPFDSFTGSILEGGNPIANVTQIDLSLDNGVQPSFVIGSRNTIEPTAGKSRLTGTLTAYFESSALYLKFLQEIASSIVLTLIDLDGNSLEFNIPNVKYTSGNTDVSDEGPITVPLEFSAVYDDIELSQIVITRTPV